MSSKEAVEQQAPYQEHRKHPCVLCQQRKVKCDRNDPCVSCLKAGIECISASTLPPRKRKRRFPEAELLARIRRYEHHLKAYGADLDAINNDSNVGDGSSVSSSTAAVRENQPKSSMHPRSLSSPVAPVQTLTARRSLRQVDK